MTDRYKEVDIDSDSRGGSYNLYELKNCSWEKEDGMYFFYHELDNVDAVLSLREEHVKSISAVGPLDRYQEPNFQSIEEVKKSTADIGSLLVMTHNGWVLVNPE